MSSSGNPILRSLVASSGPGGSIQDIQDWLADRGRRVAVQVRPVPFGELRDWEFDSRTGNLRHLSGKFFAIEGIHVFIEDGSTREWSQPIINQPEIGFLGVLAREIDGVLCFLMQAKIEPGNVSGVQLSPTLQATRSNYRQVHRGKTPLYLDYFLNATPDQILLDQLQSEQGSRFLRKRNRNIILKIDSEIAAEPDFRWMTLGQIKALMGCDNRVNMDTRTVFSGLHYGLSREGKGRGDSSFFREPLLGSFGLDLLASEMALSGVCSIDQVLFWLSSLKATHELNVQPIPLNEVKDWHISETEIVREDRRYFRILGVNVSIESREVQAWCQPIVEPMQEGICAFILKKIDGVYHFLVQAKIECGNFDVVEMVPSVQCLTGDYKNPDLVKPPFLDYVLHASKRQVIFDTMQSEEGGRFYHEQNRNLLVEADDSFPTSIPPNYHWLTLGQIKEFLRFNNYLNIQARSLIAALDYGSRHGG